MDDTSVERVLRGALVQNNLMWLVEYADTRVKQGVVEKKLVAEPRQRGGGKRAGTHYVHRRDFTSRERVQLFIKIIRAELVSAPEQELALLDLPVDVVDEDSEVEDIDLVLTESSPITSEAPARESIASAASDMNIEAVVWADEEEHNPHAISRERLTERRQISLKLAQLLDDLEARLDA